MEALLTSFISKIPHSEVPRTIYGASEAVRTPPMQPAQLKAVCRKGGMVFHADRAKLVLSISGHSLHTARSVEVGWSGDGTAPDGAGTCVAGAWRGVPGTYPTMMTCDCRATTLQVVAAFPDAVVVELCRSRVRRRVQQHRQLGQQGRTQGWPIECARHQRLWDKRLGTGGR